MATGMPGAYSKTGMGTALPVATHFSTKALTSGTSIVRYRMPEIPPVGPPGVPAVARGSWLVER